MSSAVITIRLDMDSIADSAIKAATRFWFAVTVVGQLLFAFAVASFYGLTAARGNFHAWNRFFSSGYVEGDTMGHVAIIMHVTAAVVIMLSGAVQLVQSVRDRFPAFHHWNGRIYVLATVAVSVAGVYMTWFRSTIGDVWQHLGSTANALLIWICAALALRYAMGHNFRAHRRWALRLFIVAAASWFLRIMLFFTLLVSQGPVGFDPTTFRGPFLTFLSFGQFLVPLAFLEIYLWAKDHPGVWQRMAGAATVFAGTLAMAGGIFAVTMAAWVPQVKAGFDPRTSIAETLAKTIAANGVDAAIKQYQQLKSTEPTTYNFDETELNNLGYQLLRKKEFPEAIRILALNIEAYPKSANVYDSLGEAYADAGDKALAIANYERSLQLNPKNAGAVIMVKKLKAQ